VPHSRSTALVLITLTLSLIGGCFHKSPQLAVVDAQVTEATQAGVVLSFELEAANYNTFELPLREVRYTVFLDGQRIFRGVRSPEATLRRRGTQLVRLPAAIPTSTTIPTGDVDYRIEGRIKYVTPGPLADVLFDAGVVEPTERFTQVGSIFIEPLAPAPAAEPSSTNGPATGPTG